MNKKVFSVLGLFAILTFLFAAVGVTNVYAAPGCPGSPSCSDKENAGWGGTTNGQDDKGNNDSVCGKGKGVGNPHCGGSDTPEDPELPKTPTGGTGPGSAPRTGSAEEPITGSLLRLGGFGTLFAAGLAFSIRRWRKSLL